MARDLKSGTLSAEASEACVERKRLPKSQDPSFYKVELCNMFLETGLCVYGRDCRYAHALSELVPRTRGFFARKKYKTESCTMYAEGYCRFGNRCAFVHTKSRDAILAGAVTLGNVFSWTERHTHNPFVRRLGVFANLAREEDEEAEEACLDVDAEEAKAKLVPTYRRPATSTVDVHQDACVENRDSKQEEEEKEKLPWWEAGWDGICEKAGEWKL